MKKNLKLLGTIIFISTYLAGCGATLNEPERGNEAARTYQMYYEQSPEAAYTADEWMVSGRLQYPFDLQEDTSQMQISEMFARFYVPKEALEQAETENLLKLSAAWPMTSYFLYNEPSHYLNFLTDNFNAADALVKREDLAEAVLDLYEKEEFFANMVFSDSEEQKAYKQEASACEKKIVLEEILLASDVSFEQMDEEMQERTLYAVVEKIRSRESGDVIGGYTTSGFFAYVSELHQNGGSRWYDYIMTEHPDSEMADYLETFENHSWLQ